MGGREGSGEWPDWYGKRGGGGGVKGSEIQERRGGEGGVGGGARGGVREGWSLGKRSDERNVTCIYGS